MKHLSISPILIHRLRTFGQVILVIILIHIPLRSQCDPEYTYFDSIPENVNIINGDSCFYTSDLDVMDSLIAINNLDYYSPLELGTQTWFGGRLKILIAGNYGNSSGVNDTIYFLPDNISNWDQLSSLNLEWNRIESLPESFSQLTNLQSLYISNNQLQYLPNDFGDLTNLYFLDIGYNELDSLPESFCNLSGLTYFWAFNNALTTVPACICSLNLDWNDTDGAFYPYVAIGGNQLCSNLPDCIETSEHLHTSLDQFYYSFMVTDSQDCEITSNEFLNYVSFQVGNRWQYEGFEFYVDSTWSTGFFDSQIIGDTIMSNGLKYLIFDNIPLYGYSFVRIDSANQILYFYGELYGNSGCENNEWDFLDYSFLDSAYWNDCVYSYGELATTELFIESQNDTFSSIIVEHLGSETQTLFSENLGISNISISSGSAGNYYKLIAATINGIQYGDYVSIGNQIVLPKEIILHQNYPNPFNPTTTIRFSVKTRGNVSLQVIDITGRLVETLVNSKLVGGEHEIKWNAGEYPSGVYYIKLESGNTSEIKKVLLLK
jgi:Leucine-rich repeat (LRR) protein